MTHWITADWPAPANIHAVTTLRTGGVSQPPFNSLNPAQHVGDHPAHVIENRQRLHTMLALPSEPVWLTQTHSNIAICADQTTPAIEADASYTQHPKTVCAVLTADCLPILLCNQEGTHIAAIHAGWRGLLSGIIENTLAHLPKENLIAWLGPAIGPHCFEVGADVKTLFSQQSNEFSTAFTPNENHKFLANIYQLANIILTKHHIQHIYGGQHCTVKESEKFFSYRRDQQTGRMASLIWIS